MNLNNIYSDIYIEYYDKIYWHCYRKLRNKQDAEDCTHDVFVLLYEKKIAIGDKTKFWLYKAADNIIMNFNKKKRQRQSDKELDENDSYIDPFNDDKNKIELDDFLEPDESKLLNDYIVFKKTDAELSEELNISPAAIRQRVSRIKNKLRNCKEFTK